jgi:16S rRNA pseudouridine516 synthase
MLNKPAGVITSTADPNHDTVLSLLRPPFSGMSLFPVGRLDVDTEGLLILTNDGILCHRLTSPRTGTDKTYLARLRDPLDEAAFADYRARLSTGVTLGDGMLCQPARLSRADSTVSGDSSLGDAAGAGSLVLLTIQEGKYHQVKRMFKMLGNEVVYLRRVAMGDLALDPALAPGEYRELTPEEVAGLRAACGLTERGQIDGIDDEGESDDGL